jgi:hypothetical protein
MRSRPAPAAWANGKPQLWHNGSVMKVRLAKQAAQKVPWTATSVPQLGQFGGSRKSSAAVAARWKTEGRTSFLKKRSKKLLLL